MICGFYIAARVRGICAALYIFFVLQSYRLCLAEEVKGLSSFMHACCLDLSYVPISNQSMKANFVSKLVPNEQVLIS